MQGGTGREIDGRGPVSRGDTPKRRGQRVPLGTHEPRVHHGPVPGHVHRVLAAEVQQPVQRRRASARARRPGPPGVRRTPRPGRRRRRSRGRRGRRGPGRPGRGRCGRGRRSPAAPAGSAQVEGPLAGDVVPRGGRADRPPRPRRPGRRRCARRPRAAPSRRGAAARPVRPRRRPRPPRRPRRPKTWSKCGWVSARCVTSRPSTPRIARRSRAPSRSPDPGVDDHHAGRPGDHPAVRPTPDAAPADTAPSRSHPASSQVTVIRRR